MIKTTISSDDELERIQKDILADSKKVLYLAMNKMMNLAVAYAPVDTGMLKNSITLTPSKPGSDVYDLTDGVDYGIHVEYGTKPHFVPIAPLKLWAKRKFGEESIGYAIRAVISKRGMQEHPFFRPALHEVKIVWLPAYEKQLNKV